MHKKRAPHVIGKGLSGCALIVSLYRASIPLSFICFLTASLDTSSLWKIPVAKAASASVVSGTLRKCSFVPALLEAMIGMVITHPFCLQNKSLSHTQE